MTQTQPQNLHYARCGHPVPPHRGPVKETCGECPVPPRRVAKRAPRPATTPPPVFGRRLTDWETAELRHLGWTAADYEGSGADALYAASEQLAAKQAELIADGVDVVELALALRVSPEDVYTRLWRHGHMAAMPSQAPRPGHRKAAIR